MVTVFSAPVPLRVGVADLSILVQNARDASPVLDAQIALRLSRAGDQEIDVTATRSQAANKLFYAAHPSLPAAGPWQVTLQIRSNGRTFDVPGEIGVLPREAPWMTNWPYFVPVPLGLLLFLVNQAIKSRRKDRT